jgi:antitoxin component HigA of HigAB toxin-antitoxin module
MRVVEKTRHIDVDVQGSGAEAVATLIRASLPQAVISEEDDREFEDWEGSDLQKEIKAITTPGKLVRAYRARKGLSLVDLAKVVGTKYPNLSAIENDRRTIGLSMARKLGKALDADYQKFLG